MVTEKQIALATEYLAGKTIEGIWVNSNGELFSNEHLAKSSDKTAKFIENTTLEKNAESDADKNADDTDPTKTVTNADADKKAENLKLLSETELTKENYNTMASLVKAFDLQTSDRKAETFIEALTKFKTNLNPV